MISSPPKRPNALMQTALSGFSSIPFVGGILTEITQQILHAPYEKQLHLWREKVTEALQTLLQKDGKSAEELSTSDIFPRVLVKSSFIAAQLSTSEKLSYLKNGIIYAGRATTSKNIEETILIYLRFIDEFTVGHIQTLKTLYTIGKNIDTNQCITDKARNITGLGQTAFYIRDFSQYTHRK